MTNTSDRIREYLLTHGRMSGRDICNDLDVTQIVVDAAERDGLIERVRQPHGGVSPWFQAVKTCRCDCGQWSGVKCGHDSDTKARFVPPYLRGTCDAAGTRRGAWQELDVDARCAGEMMLGDPDWVQIQVDGEWLDYSDWMEI